MTSLLKEISQILTFYFKNLTQYGQKQNKTLSINVFMLVQRLVRLSHQNNAHNFFPAYFEDEKNWGKKDILVDLTNTMVQMLNFQDFFQSKPPVLSSIMKILTKTVT